MFPSKDANHVPFVVARMSCCLDEILKSPPTNSMCDFVPFKTNCFQDNTEGLVGIQVTMFDCGGIVIGVCMHHRTSDAMSMTNFIKCWADETAATYFQMPKGDLVKPDFTIARELFPPIDSIPEKLLKTIDNNSFELCNLIELSPIDVDFVEKLQKPGAILGFLQENQKDENQRVKTVGFSNWCNFGHYNIDFGWGSPIWIAYAHKNDALNNRITFMMDSRSSGVEIWMIAKEDEVSILESNPEFLVKLYPYILNNNGYSLISRSFLPGKTFALI